jgi:hypothetical protein
MKPTTRETAQQLADTFMIRYHQVFTRTGSENKARLAAWRSIARLFLKGGWI